MDGAGQGVAYDDAAHECGVGGVGGGEDAQEGRAEEVVLVGEAAIDAGGGKFGLGGDGGNGCAFEAGSIEHAGGGVDELVECLLAALLLCAGAGRRWWRGGFLHDFYFTRERPI